MLLLTLYLNLVGPIWPDTDPSKDPKQGCLKQVLTLPHTNTRILFVLKGGLSVYLLDP